MSQMINIVLTQEQYKTLMRWAIAGQTIYLHDEENDNRFNAALDFSSEVLKSGKDIPGFTEKGEEGIILSDEEHDKMEEKISSFVQMAIEEAAMIQAEMERAKNKKKKKQN